MNMIEYLKKLKKDLIIICEKYNIPTTIEVQAYENE